MPPGERSTHSEVREMAQQAKVLATKPGDLSLIALDSCIIADEK